MALQLRNPGGLYQGEAPLNPLPYVNIALQQRARRQAREDAIDKYYRELPNTINDKGVRDQEIPLINEYRNKIFEYGLKNKEALRNPKLDNGAAQFNLNKLMQEAQGVARQSQELGRRSLERGKMYLSKEGRWAVDDEDFMTAEELESLPINDPRHKQMDMPSLLSNRPFDESEFGKELKGKVKYGTEVVTTDDPNDPLMNIVSQVPSLDKNAKGELYGYVANKYNGNKRFREFIQKATTEQLNIWYKTYKDKFGVEPKEDEDFAVGYAITQLPISSTRQKKERDIGAIMDKRNKFAQEQQARGFAHAERMAALRFGYSKALKDYTAGVDAAQDQKVLNTFLNNTIGSGFVGNVEIGGEKTNGVFSDLPKDISKKYTITVTDPSDPKYTIEKEPDSWFFTEDKKFAIPLYYEDPSKKSGNLITNPNQKPVSMQNIKVDLAKLLLGQKQRGGEVIEQFDGSGVQQQSPSGNKPAKTKTINVTTNKQTIPGWN